ncbi:MAG: hypothetical protein QOG85_1188 [Gaiellaceae bacterium]|jgi:hypothetical protein|nr:hypothetical protein [Gaiellaceae bacterium]
MFRSFLRRLRWPLTASAAVLLVSATSSALAGSGVGGYFNLGKRNTVNRSSLLTGSTAGAQLRVANASTASTGAGIVGQTSSATGAGVLGVNAAGGPAIEADVTPGTPPLQVNSNAQVPNLNASLLGGHDASYFMPDSTIRHFGPVVVAGNTSPNLITVGQLSFIASCQWPSPGQVFPGVYFESSADGAAVASSGEGRETSWPMANAGNTVPLFAPVESGDSPRFRTQTGSAVSADGHEVFFSLYAGAHAAGAIGDNCVFGGSIVTFG